MREYGMNWGQGLYRSRNGVILGVCTGIAEYFDFSIFWVRTIAVIFLLLTGLWPIAGVYFIAALMMKPEPVIPFETEDEEEFYDNYVHMRRGAIQRLKRRYETLDHRIQRMENIVTSREFDWEQRLNA